MAKVRSLPMINDEKSCFVQIQVQRDFRRFPLVERIRAWWLIQGKEIDVLKQAQELCCLRELRLVVSSNLDLSQRQPKAIFLKESLEKATFWHFEQIWRGKQLDNTWYYLILVNTSWQCVETELPCAGAQQLVGGGIGMDTQYVNFMSLLKTPIGNLHWSTTTLYLVY